MRPRTRGSKEAAHGGCRTRTHAIVEVEGADVEARGERTLGGPPCLLDDRVDGQSEEDKPRDDQIASSAREKMAVMSIATVDPGSEGREVSADRLQDSGTMHRVKGVGDVNRDSNLGRVQAMLVKPPAGSVDDGFAATGVLTPS